MTMDDFRAPPVTMVAANQRATLCDHPVIGIPTQGRAHLMRLDAPSDRTSPCAVSDPDDAQVRRAENIEIEFKMDRSQPPEQQKLALQFLVIDRALHNKI